METGRARGSSYAGSLLLLPLVLLLCPDRTTGLHRDSKYSAASAQETICLETHLTLMHARYGRERWTGTSSALKLRLRPADLHKIDGSPQAHAVKQRFLGGNILGVVALFGRLFEMVGVFFMGTVFAALQLAPRRSRKEDDSYSIRPPSIWEDTSAQRRRRRRRRPRRTDDDDDDDDEEERTGRGGWGYGRFLLILILLVVVECFDDVVEDAGDVGEGEGSDAAVGGVTS